MYKHNNKHVICNIHVYCTYMYKHDNTHVICNRRACCKLSSLSAYPCQGVVEGRLASEEEVELRPVVEEVLAVHLALGEGAAHPQAMEVLLEEAEDLQEGAVLPRPSWLAD